MAARYISAVGLLAVCSAWIVAFASGKLLSADGASYLMQMIDQKQFFIVAWQRQHAEYVTQWPVVMGLRYFSFPAWSYYWLYSGGIILAALTSVFFTMRWLRDRPDLLVFCATSFLLLNLNSDYVIMGEHNILVFCVWPMVAFCLFPSKSAIDQFAFLVFGFVAVYSYETSVVLMSGVFSLCAWKLLKPGSTVLWGVFAIGAALALWSVGVGVHGILFPRDAGNKYGFSQQIMSALQSPLPITSGIMLTGVAASVLTRWRWPAIICALAAGLILLNLASRGVGITAEQSFAARTMTLSVVPILLVATIALRISSYRLPAVTMTAAVAFLCIASSYSIWNQGKWITALGDLKSQLQKSSGIIDFNAMDADKLEFYSPWALPSASILLNMDCVSAIVDAPFNSWQPFDPHQYLPAIDIVHYSQVIGGTGCS